MALFCPPPLAASRAAGRYQLQLEEGEDEGRLKIFVTPSDLIVNDCVGWGTQTVPNRNKIVFLPTFWDSLQDSHDFFMYLKRRCFIFVPPIKTMLHVLVEPKPYDFNPNL